MNAAIRAHDFERTTPCGCAGINEQKLDGLIALHDGSHFIETPDPVIALTGFKSIGPAAVVVWRDGAVTLIVTPEWGGDRARDTCPSTRIIAANDPISALAVCLAGERSCQSNGRIGRPVVSPWGLARRLIELLPNTAIADDTINGPATIKTEEEIAHAGEATRIAESGYRRVLEIALLGISEDELAVELKWHSKTLGAEDNFLLLCAGPRLRAVGPSTGRRLQTGDILLAEITPSYRGQLAQICRTVVCWETQARLCVRSISSWSGPW